MPKENKKRGRRMKRKLEEEQDSNVAEGNKRQKPTEATHEADFLPLNAEDESLEHAYPPVERAFFGMLDDEEQEYFKRVDEMLELDTFESAEERDLVLANVYREAQGKELKIAQSQSCSRVMERLIQLSSASQLKQLFQVFSGNFIHLFSHRFASHCCEALFLQAAHMVTEELLAPPSQGADGAVPPDEIYVSMENLFLHTLAELEGSVGYLMTDQYASHVLRVLLLVLAGEPLDKNILQSKRKESISVQGSDAQSLEKSRSVPKAFLQALEKLIAESVAGLDTAKLRALSTHPNGNPTLQLLLKLELVHFGKQRAKDETSIIRKLLPDDPITSDSGSAAFINGLMYDPVGSHLMEQIVQHAPAKMFKRLNKEFFKEKLASFARNEVAGYVVCRVLERLGKDDLSEAQEVLVPVVPSLLDRERTVVIRTLIERCAIRGIDTDAIAEQIDNAYRDSDGFEIKNFLKLDNAAVGNGKTANDSVQSSGPAEAAAFHRPAAPAKIHFNLLAQAMLLVPGSLSSLILESLVTLDPSTMLQIAKDPVACRTVQATLTTKNGLIIERRKLIQHFYGHIGEMALDKNASHVVDCIWEGTQGLGFIRERIAEELAENEAYLRDSQYGRAVWKNWKMDIYKRRRQDWIRQSKESTGSSGFQSLSELDVNKEGRSKTPLDRARERYAKRKVAKDGK